MTDRPHKMKRQDYIVIFLLLSATVLTIAIQVYRCVVLPKEQNRQSGIPLNNKGALRLEANKSLFHIDDEILLRCFFSNKTDRVLYVQSKRPHNFSSGVTLEVGTSGCGWYYMPWERWIVDIDKSFYSAVQPHKEVLLFRVTAQAGHILGTKDNWFPSWRDEVQPPPFSRPTEYYVDATYSDKKPKRRKGLQGMLQDQIRFVIAPSKENIKKQNKHIESIF